VGKVVICPSMAGLGGRLLSYPVRVFSPGHDRRSPL
jgi:hypothetical protein